MSTVVIPAPFPIHSFAMPDNGLLNNTLAFPLVSTQDSITAHSGGGQTNAFQISAYVNRISVVAAPADSVKLPSSEAGRIITIISFLVILVLLVILWKK